MANIAYTAYNSSKEMIVMDSKKRKNNLSEIARRAALIKTDKNLRHTPNKNDLRVESEHSKLMIYPQYQTIKHEEDSE